MSDNNFRQELVSPETGNTIVVGTPSEAARLRSEGWTEPEVPKVELPPVEEQAGEDPKKTASKTAGGKSAGTDVSKPGSGFDVKTDK